MRAITFPVAGPVSYVNDFGACRDGCARAHKGNDVIGDRLQPLLAMHDGVIDHLIISHPTAGFGVTIRGDDGWRYDTYHMNNDTPGTDDGADDGTWRFLPGIVDGARVTAGQQIGWMGDSGNSEGSVPHVHVEIHTPDGQAVNPYWSLRAAQRAVNCTVVPVGDPLPAPVTPAGGDAGAAAPTTSTTVASQALAGGAEPAVAAAPQLAATTNADAAASAADWLDAGWRSAALPSGWVPFTVTGGHPNSGRTGGPVLDQHAGVHAGRRRRRPRRGSPLRRRRRLCPADGRGSGDEHPGRARSDPGHDPGDGDRRRLHDDDHDVHRLRCLCLPRQQLGRVRRLRPGQGRPAGGAGRQGGRAGRVRPDAQRR